MNQPNSIFDRSLLKKRRARAAPHFADYDFLKREACEQLADRLQDMARSFPLALDLGCHSGQMLQTLKDRGNIQRLVQADICPKMITQTVGERIICDEEWLPFSDNSFDLVLSAWNLHWVNDLPGALIQIRRILKPDGLFLAVLPGAHSLRELRMSIADIQAQQTGGISPHVAPFIEVRDAGNLLSRAGFALPVVDSDTLTITYEHALMLMHDLRGMGENNMMIEQNKRIPSRDFFAQIAAHYAQHFNNNEGRINATMELITLTAWAPHASQQQPASRGSGQINLGAFLS